MTKRVIIVGMLFFLLIGVCWYPVPRRSIAGRAIRLGAGEPLVAQEVNDLAEDAASIPELQTWATDILADFSERNLKEDDLEGILGANHYELSGPSIPEFVDATWSTKPSFVAVRYSDEGHPECVVLAWYVTGLYVGPKEFVASDRHWMMKQVKPGVFAYGRER